MTPYVLLSAAVHAGLLSFFLWLNPGGRAERKYYVIDFMGGQSGAGQGLMQPAPAPQGTVESAPAEKPDIEPPPAAKQEDPRAVTVKKEDPGKKEGKKKAAKKAEKGKEKAPRDKGEKGGRGISADGKGDVHGTKTGPVGGVGTSLEIGGFGPGGAIQTGPRFPYQWYVQTIYKRLWTNWDRTDAGNRQCGVSFTINRDGAVADVLVKETSGDAFFDMTATRAVTNAAPFPPLPEGFEDPRLPVFVNFRLQ